MRWKKYTVPLYEIDIFFFISKDSEAVERKIDALGYQTTDTCTENLIEESDEGGCAIALYQGKRKAGVALVVAEFDGYVENIAVAVHELVHVKNMIWEQIGQDAGVKPEHDEPEAYLMQRLTEAFLEFAL